MNKRVAYLCLQATREGQASYSHVNEIINGLRRRGWDVELFEPGYARAVAVPSPWAKVWSYAAVQFRLWHRAWQGRSRSLLYVRAHPFAWPTAIWAKLMQIPVIQEVNGIHEDMFIAFPWTRLFKKIFLPFLQLPLVLASRVIVVTEQLEPWARREGGHGRVTVVPNGANVELFRPDAPHRPDLPQPYVVFFGVLARWQGIDTLLDATRHPDWPSQVHLVIVGDGVERGRVEAAARDRRVLYLGRIPQRDLAGIVAGSLAGVVPANNLEGRSEKGLSPLKLYETLACGVPVILTDVPGQADLVREVGAGLVVPLGDPAAIARAVAYLASHDADRTTMGRRGRDAIVREHSWDRRAEMTSDLLASLASVEQVHV